MAGIPEQLGHVRLDGPPGRRIAQGGAIEGISEEQVRARMHAPDRARAGVLGPELRESGQDHGAEEPVDPDHLEGGC